MLKIANHRLVMTKIIKAIYSDISIGSLLGFKGGTALYLFYDLPRFSIDLDFDLLDETKKELVFHKVGDIVRRFGQLRAEREKHLNLFWMLSYEKGQNQLKVEISKRVFGSSYEVKNYLGLSALIMKKEDMFAHKLAALTERKVLANRDIFDIWFMLDHNWDVNWNIIETRLNTSPLKYLKRCLLLLEKNPPERILSGLGELVDAKTKIWIKTKLLADTIFLLKVRLENN